MVDAIYRQRLHARRLGSRSEDIVVDGILPRGEGIRKQLNMKYKINEVVVGQVWQDLPLNTAARKNLSLLSYLGYECCW
jgi:hypothetical protein